MASRDHFRLDVLTLQAGKLQQVDAELSEVERLLKLEEAGAAGACPSCGALYARGAAFCWQCGIGPDGDGDASHRLFGGACACRRLPLHRLRPRWNPPRRLRSPRRIRSRAGLAAEPPAGGKQPETATVPAWLAWAPRVVTDRRWAGPLSACALGLGLFVGVAIGPGASGGLASGAGQIIRLPAGLFGSEGSGGDNAGEGEGSGSGAPLAALGSPVGNSAIPVGPAAPPAAPPAALPLAPVPSPVPTAPSTPQAPHAPVRPGQHHRPTSPDHNPPPQKPKLEGVVVHVNPAADSYTVASPGGGLSAVHASKLSRPRSQGRGAGARSVQRHLR